MILFRLSFAATTVVLAILLYFFAVGIADGSVSSFNIALWLGLLAAVGCSLGGGLALNGSGRRRMATALLGVVALPGIAAGLFLLLLLITQPHWN